MLTNKEKKYLKSLSNNINKYNIGKDEISDELIFMLNNAIKAHELIKLVFNKVVVDKQEELTSKIVLKLGAELVFSIGHTCIIYKQNKDKKDYIKFPN